MAGWTDIEWTDRTWNLMRGCSPKSEGCRNCYAMRQAIRMSGAGGAYEGLVRKTAKGPRWTGAVRFVPELLDLPHRWREPSRIFVASMSDPFHPRFRDAQIDAMVASMYLAPQHVFQVLTKDPERMSRYLSDPALYDRVLRAADVLRARRPKLTAIGIANPTRHPAPWVQWGTSVENQETADDRLRWLARTPAAVRIVSYEPALGFVDFTAWRAALHGIFVGGESGPGARAFDVEWALRTIDFGRRYGIAIFVKQLGRRPIANSVPLRLKSRKGKDMGEWAPELRVRDLAGAAPGAVLRSNVARRGAAAAPA